MHLRAVRWRCALTHPLFPALAAFLWLLLRSGRKPTRLAYPCQQAALGSTTILIGIPLALGIVRFFRRLPLRRRHALALGTICATLALGFLVDPVERTPLALGDRMEPPSGYTASLYVVENAGSPASDRHPGVDDLVTCMADGDLDFYRSPSTGPAASPAGILGADDVVLVKVNQQWSERGGTNTDVLRGIIRRIVEHPDGFTGEVVVVENTQGYGGLDWPLANAEDPGQSVLDVVNDFVDEGWSVGTYLWDPLRATSVAEYMDGDDRDGYVVDAAMDPETLIRVSYPKFRTPRGKYVSLRRGVFDPETQTYGDERLTFINVPVMKCHSIYGVTASVKHHVGTMTTALSTSTHQGVGRGGCGSFLADVRMPDLNILDCIYVLARPGSGPSCGYEQATRVNELVASVDPIALDIWAVANILVPTILANGYTSYPAQDPADPASTFRTYLDRSMDEILRAGIAVTNDLESITAHVFPSVGVDPPQETPGPPRVTRAVPNPFRDVTALRVTGSAHTQAAVEIYDTAGRLVRTLAASASPDAAVTTIWDGRDDDHRRAAAGRYQYVFLGAPDGRPIATGAVTLLR